MAEVYGEFDAESPAPRLCCSRISMLEYEHQGSQKTLECLRDLINYLDYNPSPFYQILAKKQEDAALDGGVYSFLKCKLQKLIYGDKCFWNQETMKLQLEKFKADVEMSYDYAQVAKGSCRRFSRRIAEKRIRSEQSAVRQLPIPPTLPPHAPPPPPPPPPPPVLRVQAQRRPPLEEARTTARRDACVPDADGTELEGFVDVLKEITNKIDKRDPVSTLRSRSRLARTDANGSSSKQFTCLLDTIRDPGTRGRLRATVADGDNQFESPTQRCKRLRQEGATTPSAFNQELVKKFKNCYSSPQDSPCSASGFTP